MTDEIFKYDIDFSKEVQPGDRFSVVMAPILPVVLVRRPFVRAVGGKYHGEGVLYTCAL